MAYIYTIHFENRERLYIGSALDFHKRKSVHLSTLRNSKHRNTHLQRAFDKHGEEKMVIQIVQEGIEPEELIATEQRWIDKYDFKMLYNICPTAGNTYGRKHTEESRKRISENHADVSGENNPMFGTKGEKSPNHGKKRSEETKRKISEALKGRETWSKGKKRPKHSERMTGEGNSFYGKEHSAETKAKIREARRERLRSRGGKKLTYAIVKEMRMRYNEGNITVTALAKEYGLSRGHTTNILKGVCWNDE